MAQDEPNDLDVEMFTRELRSLTTLKYHDHQLLKGGEFGQLLDRIQVRVIFYTGFAIAVWAPIAVNMIRTGPNAITIGLHSGIAFAILYYCGSRLLRLSQLRSSVPQTSGRHGIKPKEQQHGRLK